MSNGLPCPNPACTHLFSPDAVQGAAALSCPRCGTVYRFRQPAAPRPTPGKPPPPPPQSKAATRVPPPPPVPPPAPPVPLAAPVGAMSSSLDFGADEVVLRHRRPRRRQEGASRLLVGCFLFLLLGGGTGWALWYFWPELQRTRSRLPDGWSIDDRLKARLKAGQAVSRDGPPGYMALFVGDYSTRDATDAEMLREAKKFLEGQFDMMQYQAPAGRAEGDAGPTLGGAPAVLFPFEGTDKTSKVPVKGHCVYMSRHGYAYWMYTWGPRDFEKALLDDWEKLRGWVALRTDREGWHPTPRPTEAFVSKELPYQLRFDKEVWTKEAAEKGEEEPPELVLRGVEVSVDEKGRRTRGAVDRMATIRAYSWPKAPTLAAAVAAGLDRVRKLVKMEDDQAAVRPLEAEGAGGKVGALPGRVLRLRIESGEDHRRYALLAVARLPEGVVGVYAECKWEARDSWQPEFMELVGAVRAAEKEGP